ncbi:MAG: sodium:alanine symporter family protein [Propionibacteriaceae bacterium]|jgi:AGCS family alanine or glycine:cation symporter|nr:sodium:alanine symporter family protein [Propionibacteriaceae bacterium]
MDWIEAANSAINSFVWGPVMLIFIVGVGVYYSFRLGFFQIAKFGTWNKNTLGLINFRKKTEPGKVSPFQAFSTAMAATAGVGNLVGVSTSIILGGPGAIFWMFVSGVFGMITKFAEITLAVRFRTRDKAGDVVGGPMYYISRGLGKNWKWLAVLFSIFGAICAFGIGNMTQINAVIGTSSQMFIDLGWMTVAQTEGFATYKLIYGIILAVLVGLVILGGLKRIGATAELLVPFAGIFCIIGSLVAIVMNADQFGAAVVSIFQGAFSENALVGGVVGYAVMNAIRFGIARGVFTNEAGLGSAPIAHAAADVEHPVQQGMWGCFEVFADTLIMCTLSALVILTSGVYTSDPLKWMESGDGAALISQSFSASFGTFGSIFIAICTLIFAYCTTLSWSLYGVRCFQYLTKGRGIFGYRLFFCLIVVVAAVMQLTLAWDIADTLNGLMAIPNLVALIGLSGLVVKIYQDWRKGTNEYSTEVTDAETQ